jgi:hypothetical protein
MKKPYADQTAGCQLLMLGIMTQTPTLVLKAADSKLFKNSDTRRQVVTVINAIDKLQSKPAALHFCQSTKGMRPPSMKDQRACWDLAARLDETAWGKDMHLFSTALEVRANAVADFWAWYLAYETSLDGLFSHLEHVVPALINADADLNVIKQHARDVINKASFALSVPDQALRKKYFHEYFLAPILTRLKANLQTTLETASSAASHDSVTKKHRSVTLQKLLDETTGREYCPEAHRFLTEPAATVIAIAEAAVPGTKTGGGAAMRSPAYHQAVDRKAAADARATQDIAPSSDAAGKTPSKKRAHTPGGGQGGLADGQSPPHTTAGMAGMHEPEPKKTKSIRAGDPREFYLLYTKEADILAKSNGRGYSTPECMKEAYLKTAFCGGSKRCAQQYGTMHRAQATTQKLVMRNYQLANHELIRIANMFIDSHERLPWPADLIREAIASKLKPMRGG